ncbi:MAG: peptidoglycan DD-metalloendopeptidase family protein [Saprospiraceae bacterium]|nr:peptidoglycan DD-metalloendopeptidase family protein [Saprospiraceae bacterium]
MKVSKRVEEKKKKENRYRLVVFSDSTFEEIRSFTFQPWYIWALIGGISMLVITIIIALLKFTPLGTLIAPSDYTDTEELIGLREKVLELEESAQAQTLYINSIRRLLSGEVVEDSETSPAKIQDDSILAIPRVQEDELLRRSFDLEQQLQVVSTQPAVSSSERRLEQLFLIPPLTGSISMEFDLEKNHLGVDINAPANTPVKAVLSGHIIFSGWNLETGNTIGIQHDQNLISFYKHNSSLLKKEGAFVKAGEAVAIIGNTGTLSSGPHLHFELWLAGKPVNPTNYINFQ